jgi:hypothetical protein
MTDIDVPVGDEQVTSRYGVSRKGMGGRPPKYTKEQLDELLNLVKAGKSLLAVCKEANVPYVSIRSALKRANVWPVVNV